MSAQTRSIPLLAAQGLAKSFAVGPNPLLSRNKRRIHAVIGVDIEIRHGESVGLVGESGCGKSTLARLLTLLYRPERGLVYLDGADVTDLPRHHLKPFRRRVQIVFQDPFSSLNPRLPVSAALTEPLEIHRLGSRAQRRGRARRLMRSVGLDPSQLERYPHELSGGQRQRVAIARALAPEPDLIVADEPVSALDVSVQSQILNLLTELKEELGLAYLLISHDLAVIEHMAQWIAVMYLGRIVEQAPREILFTAPAHPYTAALIRALPTLMPTRKRKVGTIAGEVPSPIDPPSGCPYHPRCPKADELCRRALPVLAPSPSRAPEHQVACHYPEPLRP